MWRSFVVIAALLARPAFAQSMAEAAGREQQRRAALQSAPWQDYESPDGFRARFPYRPINKRELSGSGPVSTYVAVKDNRSYVVRVGAVPPALSDRSAEQWLTQVRDALVQDAKGTLESERPVQSGEYPGREFKIRVDGANEPTVLVARSYVSPEYLYLVLSAATPGTAAELAERFLSSFAIVR